MSDRRFPNIAPMARVQVLHEPCYRRSRKGQARPCAPSWRSSAANRRSRPGDVERATWPT